MGCQSSSFRGPVGESPALLRAGSTGTLLSDRSLSGLSGLSGKAPRTSGMVRAETGPRSSSGHGDMVQRLRESGAIRRLAVLEAMLLTDRRHYAPRDCYRDAAQALGHDASISAPHVHALALELLAEHLSRPAARALDVGCGSGYLSACMARLLGASGRLIALDHVPELVELSRANIRKADERLLDEGLLELRQGDGWQGCAGMAFDCIHVGAAAASVPVPLLKQLRPGGRMVIPLGLHAQDFYQIDRRVDGTFAEPELITFSTGARFSVSDPLVNASGVAGASPRALEQALADDPGGPRPERSLAMASPRDGPGFLEQTLDEADGRTPECHARPVGGAPGAPSPPPEASASVESVPPDKADASSAPAACHAVQPLLAPEDAALGHLSQPLDAQKEEILYEQTAQLNHLVGPATWAERGSGKVQLIRNKDTKLVRFVMRNASQHAVASFAVLWHADFCNLKSFAGSSKCWTWTCKDITLGGADTATLALKFETPISAREFKDAFKDAKGPKPKELEVQELANMNKKLVENTIEVSILEDCCNDRDPNGLTDKAMVDARCCLTCPGKQF